jgi:hypothetical protein
MRYKNWRIGRPAVQAALILPLVAVLAGCDSGYRHVPGTPPADTVTYPSASTQGWLQQYGTGYIPTPPSNRNGDAAYGVATDPQGNVIVLDKTYGAFPGFTNNNLPEFAVVKFDNSGNRLWTQQLGTGMGDFPGAIATDAQSNILIGGFTRGAFPGFTNAAGASESVVIKLNPSGQVLWTQQFPSSGGPSQVTSLAVDAQGDAVAGGSFEDAQDYLHGYVMKLAVADGSVVWNQGNSSTGNALNVTGVAVDSQGNVIAVGDFAGTGSSASTTYMVSKLDGTSGQTVWQQQPVTISPYGSRNQIYTQVALDAQDDVFVGGLDGSTGWGRCTVAKLADSSGTQAWQQSFGAAQSCIPGGIATDTAGNVLMTGGDLYPFFPGSNPSKLYDIFLAKLNSSGQGVWLQQFGTGQEGAPGYSVTNALVFVATDSGNTAYVAGTTAGAFPGFTNANGAFELFATQFGQ